ncbi:glycosyltransferase family 4 protein [Maribellus maritimus]|uniref:glycosyltransferase family 4 protein n=1 Tax=Maribellus maritimus TaxID=2870838 RepID=UPI001EEA7133|nr:glycosyltransferase family 4 protein [Maribellus maritimus]MCG6186906.1 glycosyltransferase family 4 protein [Maribellus maritimus]
MRTFKILETIRQGNIGGGESHVIDLTMNLNTVRYQPIVLSFTDGPMVELMKNNNIATSVIYTEKAFDFAKWKEITNFIKEEKIDLIHAHGSRAMSNVFWASQKLKIPIIYTVHGWSFHIDQKFFVRELRKRMEKFLTNKASKTICVSHSNQEDGIKLFNMKRSTVIYNSVDFEKFNPNRNFKDIRAELNIAPEITLIGYIVRITQQKDPFSMIEAMRIIAQSEKNVMLLIVGEGNLKNEAVALVNKLKLNDRIIFQPFRTDIPDILDAIDIYCLPSLWEGFPIGIIEAMAMKKPVIASPADGNIELINNGVTGIIVPEKNPEKLANELIQLHKNKKLRNSLAEEGFNFITKNFGIKRMISEIEDLYSSLLS